MKPITLTEEHKKKLLEMCNKLFPEYMKGGNFYFTNHLHEPGEYESCIEDLTKAETNFITYYCFGQKLKKNETAIEHYNKWFGSIHWFEFCMTHLTTKIYNVNITTYSPDLYRGNIIQNHHPVDYLYSEFLKISK